MIRWLRKLLGGADAAGYVAAEREIFPFWDGKRTRLGDPLAIHRNLLTDPDFDANLDPNVAAVPTVDGLKAAGRVAGAVRRAFGIKDLDSGGLTEGECLLLFCEFGSFIQSLTESTRPLRPSPRPTASAPFDASVTAPSADSGSAPGDATQPVVSSNS